MTTDIFRTRELSLAAHIATHGVKYLGPEKITDNSYYFTFENIEKCLKLERSFEGIKQKMLKGFDYKHGR